MRAIDGRLELVERALVVEIASEERLLADTGRFLKRFLCLGPLGRKLIATLRQCGNRDFDFLHFRPAEWIFHHDAGECRPRQPDLRRRRTWRRPWSMQFFLVASKIF